MAELKTKKTTASVDDFIAAIPDENRRRDCIRIAKMMERTTKAKAKMWGPNIVGFGDYHYVYESGREGDWFKVGFSPRKNDLTLYVMAGFERYEEIMKRLGKYKTGKSCLYLKKLDDVDQSALRELIEESVRYIGMRYGSS
jgi:hypothetical protein